MTTTLALGSRRDRAAALTGAAGFLLIYLAAGPVSSLFASDPAPQPNVDGAVTRAWIVENTAANAVQAAMMVLSVASLAVFVVAVARIARPVDGPARRWAIGSAMAAVAAVVVSGVLSWVLCVLAAGMTPNTVAAIRTASFIAGGTIHVALLGLFAVAASRVRAMSGRVRVFAVVVGVIAIGSLVSLAVYYAAILILAGRLLGMVWCVVAAISLARRSHRFHAASE